MSIIASKNIIIYALDERHEFYDGKWNYESIRILHTHDAVYILDTIELVTVVTSVATINI